MIAAQIQALIGGTGEDDHRQAGHTQQLQHGHAAKRTFGAELYDQGGGTAVSRA
jgi:hypothetical protein